MGLNNISRNYDKPRLSQSEIENEVLHHLLSLGFSGESFISAKQVLDEKNPDFTQIEFSYYDEKRGVLTDTLNLKNINIIKLNKENSLKGMDNPNFTLNRDRQREEEQILAGKLADAIKGGGEVDLSSLDFSGLRDKPLGEGNIIYDFQKVPVILGDKGFPEPVDLTQEIFPYLQNLKTNPLNSDIPPNFSK